MKRILSLITALLASALIAHAADPTPYSTNIDAMWFAGNKSKVLAIANARLAANPNDIAGLLITLEYQMAYSDIANLKATMDKVIAVGATVKTPNFSSLYPDLKDDLVNEETNILPIVTAAMAAAERSKGDTVGQHFIYLRQLQAAESDGLVR